MPDRRGKVDQVLRGPLDEGGRDAREGDGERKIGEKDSGTRFDWTLERRRGREKKSPVYTRLKVVHVCYVLVSESPRSTPSLSKATLRCRLQDSKFVSDKQNKHIAVDRAAIAPPLRPSSRFTAFFPPPPE